MAVIVLKIFNLPLPHHGRQPLHSGRHSISRTAFHIMVGLSMPEIERGALPPAIFILGQQYLLIREPIVTSDLDDLEDNDSEVSSPTS